MFIGSALIPGLGALPVIAIVFIISGVRYGFYSVGIYLGANIQSVVTGLVQGDALIQTFNRAGNQMLHNLAPNAAPIPMQSFMSPPYDYLVFFGLMLFSFAYAIGIEYIVFWFRLRPYRPVFHRFIKVK